MLKYKPLALVALFSLTASLVGRILVLALVATFLFAPQGLPFNGDVLMFIPCGLLFFIVPFVAALTVPPLVNLTLHTASPASPLLSGVLAFALTLVFSILFYVSAPEVYVFRP